MTAKELLKLNGDFHSSPLTDTLSRINKLFEENSVSYAVIGGLAVVRNGAQRTTDDIDVLTSKDGWNKIRQVSNRGFKMQPDFAVDLKNGVDIDLLFTGDQWEMVIPLLDAEKIREYDEELNAWFIDLLHLIELKTAVYLKKKAKDGIEIAAKDLADTAALIKHNFDRITDQFILKMRIEVQSDVRKIREAIRKSL